MREGSLMAYGNCFTPRHLSGVSHPWIKCFQSLNDLNWYNETKRKPLAERWLEWWRFETWKKRTRGQETLTENSECRAENFRGLSQFEL